MDEFEDYGYEPFEDDLMELSDREAWEDAQADMRDDFEDEPEDHDEEDEAYLYDEEAEMERRAEYAMECALGFGE